MKIDTPFYSQKWDLEKWKELGFENFEDAEYWQGSSCGILCLKMAQETFLKNEPHVISEYVRIGQQMNAYSHALGWSHDGLARLASHFGLKAVPKVKINSQDLKNFLDHKNLIIISTKWAFLDSRIWKEKLLFWKKYGGHMALVVGYNEEGFIVNHTSVLLEYNWHNIVIQYSVFEKVFTGRGIVISVL